MHRPADIKKLTIVLPCFNEGANLSHLEDELLPTLNALPCPWELVFVDDGSTDETPDLIRALSRKFPNSLSVFHPRNQGLGAALRSGIKAASGDAIVTLDADFTFHPNQIPKLFDAYDDSVDAVLGSPQLGQMINVSWIRKCLSNGVNWVYRILLRESITSTSSIFRLYRTSRLQSLVLKSRSFDINAEILIELLSSGSKVREVPAELTVRKFGASKIRVGREILNHLKMFLRIFYSRLTKPGWRKS